MTSRGSVQLILALSVAFTPGSLAAQRKRQPTPTVGGVVLEADLPNRKIKLRTREGGEVFIHVSDQTLVWKGRKQIKVSEIQAGDRIRAGGPQNAAGEIQARALMVMDPSMRGRRASPGADQPDAEEYKSRRPQYASVPEVGQMAPDFRLRTADRKGEIQLSSFRGKQPVLLIFGSYT